MSRSAIDLWLPPLPPSVVEMHRLHRQIRELLHLRRALAALDREPAPEPAGEG